MNTPALRSPLRFTLLFVSSALLWSCSSVDRSTLTVFATDADAPVLESYVASVGFPITVTHAGKPADEAKAGNGKGINAAVVQDLDCDGCYRIDADSEHYVIHGGGKLGIQYGLTELLEAYGFRFFHPARTHVPARLDLVSSEAFGKDHKPEMTLRGIHEHTLHPIEAYYDLWEPSADGLAGAQRFIDWVIRNRGNYLQWSALNDIEKDPAALEKWTAHTKAIVDAAHARGLKVGIGTELFSKANLQKSFDLIDGDDPMDPRGVIRERMKLLLALPFDVVNLSFGEFSGTDPQRFIDRLNDVYAVCQELRPGVELTTTVHVGKDVTVTFQGKTFVYYYLVQYADPHIVHWAHSVMYYDLYEDAGGAYKYDDFSEQRAFVLDHLKEGKRVAYFPEDAYWVAFDNCVPTWLPLYMRSRWLDLSKLRADAAAQGSAPLTEHVIFSSGWEWGYWQNDVTSLRMTYALPDRYEAFAEEMFLPWGPQGRLLAKAMNHTAELQNDALIGKRLAAYFASREAIMDAGRDLKIISQPDRPTFTAVAELGEADRRAFEQKVVAPMEAFATSLAAVQEEIAASGMPKDDPFFAEISDGAEINTLRARFAKAAWAVPVAVGDKKDAQPFLDEMDAALAKAREVVARRRGGMHDPKAARLIRHAENKTVYPYGYLHEADTLCFWERERIQARTLVVGATEQPPACVDIDVE